MRPEVKRKLDYADYAAFPDDRWRREIIDGELFVNPAPRPLHQRVSRRLQRQLEDYFHDRSIGEVFDAPIDLILTQHDILGPDLLVVTEPKFVTDRAIEGPPLLVVEVLSPSNRKHDTVIKAKRYAALGIEHYWIVDPAEKRMECHRLAGDTYRRTQVGEAEANLTFSEWEGLEIDLAALWR